MPTFNVHRDSVVIQIGSFKQDYVGDINSKLFYLCGIYDTYSKCNAWSAIGLTTYTNTHNTPLPDIRPCISVHIPRPG